MADGISFKMVTAPFSKAISVRQTKMPRAAMWAVRQTGREVQKAARAKAPVLSGGGPSASTLSRLQRRKGITVQSSAYGGPVPGLLKASITPSRHLKMSGPNTVSLKVGPRGQRAHLYAQKQDRRVGFMEAGDEAARANMQRIAAEAFNRVWKG